MATLIEFNIEYNEKTYREINPIYELGSYIPIYAQIGRNITEYYVAVRFVDGTVIEKINNLFMVDDCCFASLDETFQVLSEDVVETILFNIEIFRRL